MKVFVLFNVLFRGDNCIKQNWTYHLHPEKDDLELEGSVSTVNVTDAHTHTKWIIMGF